MKAAVRSCFQLFQADRYKRLKMIRTWLLRRRSYCNSRDGLLWARKPGANDFANKKKILQLMKLNQAKIESIKLTNQRICFVPGILGWCLSSSRTHFETVCDAVSSIDFYRRLHQCLFSLEHRRETESSSPRRYYTHSTYTHETPRNMDIFVFSKTTIFYFNRVSHDFVMW